MPSDNTPSKPEATWSGLEDRVQRLLDNVVKLRTVNAQLMKENQKLKLQSGQAPSLPPESHDEEIWRRKYEEALEDIRQLKGNLHRMKALVEEQGGVVRS